MSFGQVWSVLVSFGEVWSVLVSFPTTDFSTTDFSPILSRCFLLVRRFLIDFESMLLPLAAISDRILHITLPSFNC